MDIKLLEVRDKGTFIPMMAIQLNPRSEAERYLLARAGYGQDQFTQSNYILMGRCDGGTITYDRYAWGENNRTYRAVHMWLYSSWNTIQSGDVIDVEYILGETQKPKPSERDER